eukprot:363205-Chlamydomonas_euryale.AAC.3
MHVLHLVKRGCQAMFAYAACMRESRLTCSTASARERSSAPATGRLSEYHRCGRAGSRDASACAVPCRADSRTVKDAEKRLLLITAELRQSAQAVLVGLVRRVGVQPAQRRECELDGASRRRELDSLRALRRSQPRLIVFRRQRPACRHRSWGGLLCPLLRLLNQRVQVLAQTIPVFARRLTALCRTRRGAGVRDGRWGCDKTGAVPRRRPQACDWRQRRQPLRQQPLRKRQSQARGRTMPPPQQALQPPTAGDARRLSTTETSRPMPGRDDRDLSSQALRAVPFRGHSWDQLRGSRSATSPRPVCVSQRCEPNPRRAARRPVAALSAMAGRIAGGLAVQKTWLSTAGIASLE